MEYLGGKFQFAVRHGDQSGQCEVEELRVPRDNSSEIKNTNYLMCLSLWNTLLEGFTLLMEYLGSVAEMSKCSTIALFIILLSKNTPVCNQGYDTLK